jgi:hypothetical protein
MEIISKLINLFTSEQPKTFDEKHPELRKKIFSEFSCEITVKKEDVEGYHKYSVHLHGREKCNTLFSDVYLVGENLNVSEFTGELGSYRNGVEFVVYKILEDGLYDPEWNRLHAEIRVNGYVPG